MAIVTPVRDQGSAMHGIRAAWQRLDDRGYAILRDTDIGLCEHLRTHFCTNYFDVELEADNVEVHKDRDRARDVVMYEWQDDAIGLTEYPTVAIANRSGYVGTRDHRRVRLLADRVAADWLVTMLCLVPPHRRQRRGTFGVNFFRTRSTIVSGPHRDDEELCLVYVVDKAGDGAETRLHRPDNQEIELRHVLNSGEILIFDDARYLHDVTPLLPNDTGPCKRDAIVCTVNYNDTYPVYSHPDA